MAWTKQAFDNTFGTILVPQSSPRKKIGIDMVLQQRNSHKDTPSLERGKSKVAKIALNTRTIKGEGGTDTYMDHVSALTPTLTTQEWPLGSSSPLDRRNATFYIHAPIRCSVPAQWSSFIRMAGAVRVNRRSRIQRRHQFQSPDTD
jgi:hypothetical protein